MPQQPIPQPPPKVVPIGAPVPTEQQPVPIGGVIKTGNDQVDSLDFAGDKTPPSWMQSAMSQLKDLGSTAWQAGPVGQITGAAEAIRHPIDTAKNLGQANADLAHQAHDAFSQGDYATGVVKSVKYLLNGIPGLGTMLDQSSNELAQGNYGKAIGPLLGTGASLRVGEMVLPAVEKATAVRAAKSPLEGSGRLTADLVKAIPPTKSAPYSPEDFRRANPYLASEHSSSPITTVEGVIDASDSAITQIEEKIGQYIKANPQDTIRTNPLQAARTVLGQGARDTDMAKGLKALDGLGLDKDLTLAQADAKRLRLNAENRAVLKKNNYDVATARKVDPAFAAREAAVEALRTGIYDQLEARGIEGVQDLRRDEGAIMRVRNAAENQKFNAAKTVAGTGSDTIRGKLTRVGVPAAATAAGEMMMGMPGAVAGGVLGNELAKKMAPGNLTRDALVERAFKNLSGEPVDLQFPTVPPTLPPRGLLEAPKIGLGAKPDTSTIRTVPAERGQIVRDPKTGRFKRVYSSEIK